MKPSSKFKETGLFGNQMTVEGASNCDYFVETGDSLMSVAAKFDTTPSRLYQINKLRNSHLFAGQKLLVVQEENDSCHSRNEIPKEMESEASLKSNDTKCVNKNTFEKAYRQIFKRIIGTEKINNFKSVSLTKETTTNDDRCLNIDASYCVDLHNFIKGTLIATFEMLIFSPSDESAISKSIRTPLQMRHDNIRSIASYKDTSVFAFTKRPRLQRSGQVSIAKSFDVTSSDDFSSPPVDTYFSFSPKPESNIHQGECLPAVCENTSQAFLCCTIRRAHRECMTSSHMSSGAQWFILPLSNLHNLTEHDIGEKCRPDVWQNELSELHSFLIACDLGLASVFVADDMLSDARYAGNEPASSTGETPATVSSIASRFPLANSLEMLIPRRNNDHAWKPSPSSSPLSYLGSLGRLIHPHNLSIRRSHKKRQHQRPLSVGSSEELFSDHTPANESGIVSSSPSTPSFAEEKEVFDILRQTSLLWELVSEEEFLLRCSEESRKNGVIDTVNILPPTSLLESHILNETQSAELFDAIPLGAQGFDWVLTFTTEHHGFSLRSLYRHCNRFLSGDIPGLPEGAANLQNNEGENPSSLHFIPSTEYDGTRALRNQASWMLGHQSLPCVLLIKDANETVFGAYLSSHPKVSMGEFYGTGEIFVFHWVAAEERSSQMSDVFQTNISPEHVVPKLFQPNYHLKKYPWSGKNSFFINGELESLMIGCSNANCALRIDGDLLHGRSQFCDTFDSPQLTTNGDFIVHTLEVWSFC